MRLTMEQAIESAGCWVDVLVLDRETPANALDRMLPELTDGTFEVVAVEVFDHADSVDNGLECYGPWVVGPRDEVYAWLAHEQYSDYEEQYSVCSQTEEGQ